MLNIWMRSFCPVHIADTTLSALYAILFIISIKLIIRHQHSISSGNATGLSCYLVCTVFYCIYRVLSLWTLILIDDHCSHSYGSDSYLDVIDLIAKKWRRLRYFQFLLSSLSLAFFYSSYSYFAYSLTKVLDMLTSSPRELKVSKANSHFINVYIGVVMTLWISVTLIWIVSLSEEKSIGKIYIWAKISHATCGLVISVYVGYNLALALLYIWRNGKDSGKGHQLFGLLKMRRIQGVCYVCVLVFTARWIVLVFQTDFHPLAADAFLLLAEVLPTSFMLYAFRSAGDGESASGNVAVEVALLKTSLATSISSTIKLKSLFNSSSLDDEDDFLDDYSQPTPLAANKYHPLGSRKSEHAPIGQSNDEISKMLDNKLFAGIEEFWEGEEVAAIYSNAKNMYNKYLPISNDSDLSKEGYDPI